MRGQARGSTIFLAHRLPPRMRRRWAGRQQLRGFRHRIDRDRGQCRLLCLVARVVWVCDSINGTSAALFRTMANCTSTRTVLTMQLAMATFAPMRALSRSVGMPLRPSNSSNSTSRKVSTFRIFQPFLLLFQHTDHLLDFGRQHAIAAAGQGQQIVG